MKKLLQVLAVAATTPMMVLAQDWTTVSATNVKGKNHRVLAAGELCFLVANELGQPTQVKLGGGGRLPTRSFYGLVKNGVVAPFAVPNPEHTQPPVSYRVTIKNSQQKEIFRYTNVRFSGDSFNFDNFCGRNHKQRRKWAANAGCAIAVAAGLQP